MSNIDNLTFKELKEIANMFGKTESKNSSHPFEIGKNYLIRTVTMANIGKLEAVYDSELVLSTCSWVADTGIFSDAMRSGLEAISSSEIEPFVNNVIVGRGAIIDASVYNFPLPTVKK